eukprot:GEMP01099126.1.p1 GENE.GEMP01099126.1~~GEMP01099126.1.p1  ORF type:complete len:258 (+),score=40.12 GEMP01099126.1:38-811(+)
MLTGIYICLRIQGFAKGIQASKKICLDIGACAFTFECIPGDGEQGDFDASARVIWFKNKKNVQPGAGWTTIVATNIEPKPPQGDVLCLNKYNEVHYKKHVIRGFTLMVDLRLDLWEGKNSWTLVLKRDLGVVSEVVPPAALKKLQEHPIWVNESFHYSDEDGRKSVGVGACTHTSADWLHHAGNLRAKLHCVELYCYFDYLTYNLHRAQTLLHELAHVYHASALGSDGTYARNILDLRINIETSFLMVQNKQDRNFL